MWAYTDFSDKRWVFTKKLHRPEEQPKVKRSQKTGLFNSHTFTGYLNGGQLFVKQADAPGKPEGYPDFGCSFEMYTDNKFLEMETLGLLATTGQGQSVTHTEHWVAGKGCDLKFNR